MHTGVYPIILALLLTGCGVTTTPNSDPVVAKAAESAQSLSAMRSALAGHWRSEAARARDQWRHPAQTLAFFELDGSEVVVEIWPGRGWYSDIIAPFLASNGGRFIAAHFDPKASPDPARQKVLQDRINTYGDRYAADLETFGSVEISALSSSSGDIAPDNSVDVVLTFRNIHNWMVRGHQAKSFNDAFRALKPGGIFGVVEHRLPPAAPFDPKATNGYVHEAYVKQLAADAGFQFVASSEINANPRDQADHPFGVWTLPPVSRTSDNAGTTLNNEAAARYLSIGESDRMTLKFVKPPVHM